ncbi:MAG: hypothetical protein DMG57_43165 [Acidobacteria bacterium]|nr:MAG: hypothetical protein DMG57_43165 [Acidobacteriota bacterium]
MSFQLEMPPWPKGKLQRLKQAYAPSNGSSPKVSAEQRREVETKLAELNEILDPLKGELSEQSR